MIYAVLLIKSSISFLLLLSLEDFNPFYPLYIFYLLLTLEEDSPLLESTRLPFKESVELSLFLEKRLLVARGLEGMYELIVEVEGNESR